MTNDSHLFKQKAELDNENLSLHGNCFKNEDTLYLPLYEAKMIHHYNHRFGDYNDLPENSKSTQLPEVTEEKLANPEYAVLPRYCVKSALVDDHLNKINIAANWYIGFRDITNSTNERTAIAAIFPYSAVGNNLPLLFFEKSVKYPWMIAINLNAFIFDFVARLKVGGTHMNFFILKQLPVLPPETYDQPCPWSEGETLADWFKPRVLELTYTAWDLQPFAKDLGFHGPPFQWNSQRRFQLRCELDAAFFILYRISPPDLQYIMDSFPIVKKKDLKQFNAYRTADTIMELYKKMKNQ